MSHCSGVWWVAIAVALCACASARAQEAPADRPEDAGAITLESDDSSLSLEPEDASGGWGELVRFTLMWENDGTFPAAFRGGDDHYTNGLKLDFAWRPGWADSLADIVPFGDGLTDVETAFGVSVFQLIFTPEDLEEKDPIPDDRPYAGWLGVGVYWQRAGELAKNVAVFDHIELDLGIIGEASGAQAVQTFIHSVFPEQTRPAGWGNQLSHELAVNLTLRRKMRFSSGANDDGLEFQFIPSFGGTVGTVYRRIEADATVRLGWHLPNDFGPTRLADVNAATGGWTNDWGVYLFVRGGGRLSEHDIFLDGNNFANSLSVSKEPLVGEASIGIVLQVFSGLEIGYSHTWLTKEFEGQNGADDYGAFTIGYRAVF